MSSLSDLYKQAQKGDSAAFYTWIESMEPEVGRFGYQLGVSYKKLSTFQQLIFQQLHKQIGHFTPAEAKIQLYKLAIQQASSIRFALESKDNRQVLGFSEDQDLHNELQNIDLNQRIPIVLFYFQKASLSDMMATTEKTKDHLMEEKRQGMEELQSRLQLEEGQVVQRLEMLQKSYQRFIPPSSYVEEEQTLADKPSVVESPLLKASSPRRVEKKKMVLLGAAGIFLAAVIGVSFSVNDQQAGTTIFQQEGTVTDEMVAEWRSQYEEIKETSPTRLGMSQEQYDQLEYVKRADAEMEIVFSDETFDSLKEEPIEMQFKMDRLFRQIETPRGMVDLLAGPNPMPSAEIEGFLRNYTVKTDELRVFADSVLSKYRQELESTIVMDQLSTEKLLAQTDRFSEELRLVVEALPEYNLSAAMHPNRREFRTVRDVNALRQQQPLATSPYSETYLSFLSTEPYFDSSGFLMPLNLIPQQLITMEQTLLGERETIALFDGVEVAYLQTFWQLIKGSSNSPVFDEEGKVKTEYRTAWNDVSSSNPMAYLMLPILEEMQESGWTKSRHYDEMKFDDLLNALEMEKSGELADKLPNGNLVIEDELVDLQDFDYSRIHPLYESFKSSYDVQILAGVPPLDVLFMYHYANKLDDTETLWHLLADSPIKPTLEVFQEEWQPIPELTENAKWIELSTDFYKRRIKDKVYIYPQVGSDEYLERLNLLLVTQKNQIWQIDYQQYDSYDLLGGNQQFKVTVDSLYELISGQSQNQLPAETRAVEVAGVFFKAVENEDITVMRKLMAEIEWTDDELRSLLELHSFRPFSELEKLTFRTHHSPNILVHLSGSVDIEYAVGSQDSVIQEMFSMEKTAAGWRMTDLKKF